MVKRGEIWLVALDPTVGSEIRKARPCVIVSPPELHDHLRTAFAAPMTTKGRPAPYRPEINFKGKQGRVVLDQIRTVDKKRLIRKLGTCGPETLRNCLEVLQDMFAP